MSQFLSGVVMGAICTVAGVATTFVLNYDEPLPDTYHFVCHPGDERWDLAATTRQGVLVKCFYHPRSKDSQSTVGAKKYRKG